MPLLTDKIVNNLETDKHELLAFDSEVKGFGVRVSPLGTKTYFYKYLNEERKQRKYKIGRHGVLTVVAARKVAKDIAAMVFLGEDPSGERKERKKEARSQKEKTKTVKDLCEHYVERYIKPDPRRREEIYRINSHILPNFGSKSISEVTYNDIESWRLSKKDAPAGANRVLALLSCMYSEAIKWGWCERNPVKGVSKYPEEKRERYLDEEELHRLMDVLSSHKGYPAADALHLIVLTGSRRGEVLNATWGQFNLESGVWTKPSHMTKQKKTEHLPLSGEALEFVQDLYERATVEQGTVSPDSYVFPGKIPGEPLKEIKKFWARVCREADLKDVHIHDLRHTYASYLVSSGLSLPIIGKLLGHTQAGTTHRYAHLANETLREATNVFGDKIKSLRERRLLEGKDRQANAG